MVVLIAGMHGVGKTFLAGPLATQLGLRHVTASALIAKERGGRNWAPDKSVNEIAENQHALVRAIAALRREGSHILLDGHLVLRGKNDIALHIPATVFRQVGVGGIVLLEASIETLLERLSIRDQTLWSATAINEFVQAERAHAQSVAKELCIPLKILHAPSPDEFRESVMEILCK